MPAKIISVASSKGGTGKTTFTIILAAALASESKKVLVIDSDQQRSAHGLYMRENENNSALYQVESLEARFLFDYLKLHRDKYDIIFLDIPRLTDKDESAAVQILTLCDGLLIPVLSGQFDIVSTLDFFNQVIKPIDDFKKKNRIPFKYYGFLNKRNQIKDNEKVIPFMTKAGLPMLKNGISDLKLFRDISVNYSILDTTTGRRRFESFYKEFKKKFSI